MSLHPRVVFLLKEAQEKSPFYKKLYSGYCIERSIKLDELPLIEHEEYWSAYRVSERNVLTMEQSDGILMKTGGTTSAPKFTSYSQSELLRTANLLAVGLMQAGLRAGDRVANLFYAGDLYGSFLLHILSVISLPIPAVQIPIGGLTPPQITAELLDVCRVTAVLSTVTSLMRLEEYCRPLGKQFNAVTVVMFSGEPIFADQKQAIGWLFPNATIKSCIYGSIDAGVIGTCWNGSSDHREHQIFSEAVLAEVILDDGTPTYEPNMPGTLVVTNLLRELSPIIRYPTGDRAEWVDSRRGIIRLKGRAQTSVRLGPVSLDVTQLKEIAQRCLSSTRILAIQLIVTREDNKDCMEMAILTAEELPVADIGSSIRRELEKERPMYKQHVDLGLIMPVNVAFKSMSQMHVSKRSGKLPEIVDLRVPDC